MVVSGDIAALVAVAEDIATSVAVSAVHTAFEHLAHISVAIEVATPISGATENIVLGALRTLPML